MRADRFRELLIDACLVASAVDGSIDEAEIAVIRDAMAHTLVGEDAVQERMDRIIDTAEEFRVDIGAKRSTCLNELRVVSLTDGQRRRLIDLCCRVVAADAVIAADEVKLLRELVGASGVSASEAELMCPEHARIPHLLNDGAAVEEFKSDRHGSSIAELGDSNFTSSHGG